MNIDRSAHWDDRYRNIGYRNVSWFSPEPDPSIALLQFTGADLNASVVDVGAGAALFVDELIEMGFRDITVMDVSSVALDEATTRVAGSGSINPVKWVQADVLEWEPGRTWDVWHDRANFHFVNRDEDIAVYRDLMARSVAPGGHAVIGTFSPQGPLTCSGLPVARYSTNELAAVFQPEFELVAATNHSHTTPSGESQEYSWVVLRRVGRPSTTP